jgi:hypothetical protein
MDVMSEADIVNLGNYYASSKDLRFPTKLFGICE